MPGLSLPSVFVSRLNSLGIPYVITGAVASIIYGEPRLTHDLDLLVKLHGIPEEKQFQGLKIQLNFEFGTLNFESANGCRPNSRDGPDTGGCN